MGDKRLCLRCALALFFALGGAGVAAQDAPAFAAAASLYPTTREYVWTFLVPVLTTEQVDVVTRALSPTLRGRRWSYELPTLKSKRYKLGQVAEFECKYMDGALPETCRTVWHNVYADLPQLAMQRDHMDYDEIDWAWQDQRLRIAVPRLSWRERTLRISVPALSAEDEGHARASVDAQSAAAAELLDEGLDALDTSIALVEAQGADPRKLTSGGGTPIDLPALRMSLSDEKTDVLDRLARIRGELDDAALRAREAGGTR